MAARKGVRHLSLKLVLSIQPERPGGRGGGGGGGGGVSRSSSSSSTRSSSRAGKGARGVAAQHPGTGRAGRQATEELEHGVGRVAQGPSARAPGGWPAQGDGRVGCEEGGGGPGMTPRALCGGLAGGARPSCVFDHMHSGRAGLRPACPPLVGKQAAEPAHVLQQPPGTSWGLLLELRSSEGVPPPA